MPPRKQRTRQRKHTQRVREARQLMLATPQATTVPGATPAMSGVSRRIIFAALSAVCLLVAGGYVAWAVIRDETGSGLSTGGPIDNGGAPGSIARISGPAGAVMFQNVLPGDHWNQVGLVPLGQPEGARTMMPIRCLRVHFAAGRGLCLAEGDGLAGTYAGYIFDADLRVSDNVKLGGLPSRARVSPDARFGATTSFVTGHSYAEEGFSTETLLVDLDKGDVIGNLEEFTAFKDGQQFFHESFNYWGVTFTRDSNRFYATLASEDKTYLVEGDIAARQVQVVHENVECPSLSPDNTRLAFKKKVGQDLGGPIWRFHVLDLTTMTETPLAETRSIDDQIEWLDDANVLYGDNTDTWIMSADGSGQPRRFMSQAVSPTVLTGTGAPGDPDSTPSMPAAGDDILILPETDLGVAITAPPGPARPGEALTYMVRITNNGPSDATLLLVDSVLPPGTAYGSATTTAPPGMSYGCSFIPEERRVQCDAPMLATGESWILEVTVTPAAAGPLSSQVAVDAAQPDPNPANNTAELTLTVGP